jgi:HK97 family phage major capsid protein
MTVYNSVIARNDAAALIPEDVSAQIVAALPTQNPIMQLARKLPNMSRAQRRMPVLSALATAYFVAGDVGLKQTSQMAWENRYIDSEELAVIVPIPEAVLDDAGFDVWATVRPEIERAFSYAINRAVLYGTNIPSTWVTNLGSAGLVAGSTAAGQTVAAASYTDLYEAILSETSGGVDGVFMNVEADGFMVTGSIASPTFKGKLRGVRDLNLQPIFKTNMQDATRYELDGTPLYFPTDGSIVPTEGVLISGDWNQLVYAIRQDITYKVLTEAVIQDGSGAIVYNLAQQDLVALRAVMRLGFALPNPVNLMNQDDTTRFPFSVLTTVGGS